MTNHQRLNGVDLEVRKERSEIRVRLRSRNQAWHCDGAILIVMETENIISVHSLHPFRPFRKVVQLL